MKRDSTPFPNFARYNVVLPASGAYFAGMVTLQGKPSVHIRIGDFTHVAQAESAIALAKQIIEQAEYAIKMADCWRRIVEDNERLDAEEKALAGALCTTCTEVITAPHVRTDACDNVYRNEKGSLCGLCDGTHEHEHRGRQS